MTQRVRGRKLLLGAQSQLNPSALPHFIRYIGKQHLRRAMDHVMDNPIDPQRPLSFSVLRVPFFLEPNYDETKPFIESNRERLVKKWGGKRGWEQQKRRHE